VNSLSYEKDVTNTVYNIASYLLTPCSRILHEKLTSFQLVKKFPSFYGTPKVHYHINQCPPPVPILSQLDPVHTPHPTSLKYILIYYPLIYACISQAVSFPQVSTPKPCIHLSSPPYALHVPPISFCSILSPEQYWVRSTDH